MNTTTPNQNKYNTKNTLASRPNKLKKKKKEEEAANLADPRRPWVWLDPLRLWVRRARRPWVWRNPRQPWSGGSGEHVGRLSWVSPAVTLCDPIQNLRDPPKSTSKLDSNALKPIVNASNSFLMPQNSFLDSNLKPRGRKLTHYGFYRPKGQKPTPERDDPRRNPPTAKPTAKPTHGETYLETYPRRGSGTKAPLPGSLPWTKGSLPGTKGSLPSPVI
jgi:hypothetical protein